MRQWTIGIAVVVATGGLLYWMTLAGAGTECEACMRYEGREACRSATGADRQEAERTAIATACALVSSGVTDTIRCQGIEPLKLTCATQ